MRIEIDLTNNEARLLKELLNCQDFERLGFSDEEGDDACNVCNKITNAIDEREVNANRHHR